MKIFSLIFLFFISTSQLFSQEINGPTSWDVIGNVFSQPNVHIQIGKKQYDWYGSGDVNNDEIIDIIDLYAIDTGVKNDRGDIDGDGISCTQNDRTLLEKYLNETILYLPGHWNALTTKDEKIFWLEKMIQVEDVYKYNDSGWVSNNFVRQMEIDFYGLSNIDMFIEEQLDSTGIEYYGSDNARFNIPLQFFSVQDTLGKTYALCGTLVGSNPLNFDDWYFADMNCEMNYARVQPGDSNFTGEGYAKLNKNVFIENPEIPGEYKHIPVQELVNFAIINNCGVLSYYDKIFLILENPNNFEIKIENLKDINLNYEVGIDINPKTIGMPKAIVSKSGLKATLNYKDGKKIVVNNTYPDHDYYFNRTWTGKVISNGVKRKDTKVQKIRISDIQKPYGIVPPEATLIKEDLDYNGGLSTELTGEMSGVGDNSNLPVSIKVYYDFVYEDQNQAICHAYHSLSDVFGNDTTFAPQIIIIKKPRIILQKLKDIIINSESEYQNLTPGSLESQGFEAEPKVTTLNTTSDYSIKYFDEEISITPTFSWANRDIIRTYVAVLDNGEASDTMRYKIKVRDLERPVISDLASITISKGDTLHPILTGYPEITDNVAIKDTVFKFEPYFKSETEIRYKAIAIVTDVFGNDTSYLYQNITVDLLTENEDDISPQKYSLSQNYPNPFNYTTVINYTIKFPCYVSLKVYDVLGNEEMELVNTHQSSGQYSVQVNGSNLTSGTYFYRLKAGDYVATKKMVLLK
ncbi:MAG: T9SS type A sorting domain-containing protein [Ignavibacteriales bacterium]|nr:T9SS type A sorting domain-containing protein [Ignavibacteriales bacterium]MCB9218737.1 T9SS type A sorting domain-containing protein [Ignavibacteriales bacterium]